MVISERLLRNSPIIYEEHFLFIHIQNHHLLQKYKESKEYIKIINMAKLFVLSENDTKEKESDKKDVDV